MIKGLKKLLVNGDVCRIDLDTGDTCEGVILAVDSRGAQGDGTFNILESLTLNPKMHMFTCEDSMEEEINKFEENSKEEERKLVESIHRISEITSIMMDVSHRISIDQMEVLQFQAQRIKTMSTSTKTKTKTKNVPAKKGSPSPSSVPVKAKPGAKVPAKKK